jgi:precorrin-3B methylase
MRTVKALRIIGKFSLLLAEMSENLNVATAEHYVAKFKRLHKELAKFNRKNKNENTRPAFEKTEQATAKMIVFLEGEGDPEVFAEANKTLKEAIEMLPGGDER